MGLEAFQGTGYDSRSWNLQLERKKEGSERADGSEKSVEQWFGVSTDSQGAALLQRRAPYSTARSCPSSSVHKGCALKI